MKSVESPKRNVGIHPKKLLNSKWTSLKVEGDQKHFTVTALFTPDGESSSGAQHKIERCELTSVLTEGTVQIPWRELCDATLWKPGWHE